MRKTNWRLLILSWLLSSAVSGADIALIIDDIGNTEQDAQAFLLPSEVTFSILPHTPYSKRYSRLAERQQREVMLHIPMESLGGRDPGPGALTANMHPVNIKRALSSALLSVPNALGVNNHMGSRLTQLTLPMTATMEFLHEQGLYFVDSRTTRYSKAENIAKAQGVPSTRRNVFLDHETDITHIDAQFKRLIALAKRFGQAVGIAHPYPQSMRYLEDNLPLLASQGIRLLPLSELLQAEDLRLAALARVAATSHANNISQLK